MRFSLGNTASTVAAARSTIKKFVKDNLKIYFDFKSSRAKTLEFVGTGSVNFDGSDDYIQLPDPFNYTQHTISAWFKVIDDGNEKIIFENTDGTSDGIQLRLNSSEYIKYKLNSTTITSTSLDLEDTWHHVTATYDGTTYCLYLNGVLETTGTVSKTINVTTNACIGRSSTSAANYFEGNLTKIGFWNRVLSASEVQNIMYKTYDNLKGTEKTHLISWYDLDSSVDSEGVTNTYNDRHGSNNGANNGSTLQETIYDDKAPKKPRGFDNAPEVQADLIGSGSASFDGSSDYVDCGTGLPDVTSGAFTILGWYKFDDVSSTNTLFSRGAGTSLHGYKLVVDTTPRLFATQSKAPSSYNYLTYNYTFGTNIWYHIAWVNAGTSNESKLYVDGILVSSGTKSEDILTQSDQIFKIGSDLNGSNELDGNIAQFSWFNAALTQEQIQSIKEKTYSELNTNEKTNVDGSGGALVSWWGLDADISGAVGDLNGTESLGTEVVDNAKAYRVYVCSALGIDLDDNAGGWIAGGTNEVTLPTSSSVKIKYGNNANGASIYLGEWTSGDIGHIASSALSVGTLYKWSCTVSDLTGSDLRFDLTGGSSSDVVSNVITEGTNVFYIRATHTKATAIRLANMSSGEELTLSNISLKPVTGANHGSFV